MRLAIVAAASLVLLGGRALAQSSCSLPTFASPALPSTTRTTAAVSPLVQNHWSERVTLLRAPLGLDAAQTSCPHLAGDVADWHNPSIWPSQTVPQTSGQDVTLPANTKVLISDCSGLNGVTFGIVTVPVGSELILAESAQLALHVRGLRVLGALRAGSPTCRLHGNVTITLHGERASQVNPGETYVKGIQVTGSMDLHGSLFRPTWTRLATTANVGDTWILVQDLVNWQPGQQLVVTTTQLKDARDFNHNSPGTVLKVQRSNLGPNLSWIQLAAPLAFQHYAGVEYQAEVLLLSRAVVVQGDAENSEPTDTVPLACTDSGNANDLSTFPCPQSFLTGFGGHIRVESTGAQGRLSGVELFRMGQTNVLGRYPMHFHLIGQSPQSYVRDCAVHRSFFRCYAIHGSHNITLTENVGFDAIGHCFFIEDGVEENNTLSYNAGAHVHMLGDPELPSLNSGQQWWAQYLDWTDESATLILPSDLTASVFYITNAHNTFLGNAASGGWAGYAFPSLTLPVKLFQDVTNMSPKNRPLIAFKGNSAHSTGFWWRSAGGLYLGGELKHQYLNGPLTYTPGRSASRDTCADPTAGTPAGDSGCWNLPDQLFMVLEDTKVFLANRGLQDWGDRAELVNIEFHDVNLAMNVFGQVRVHNMLMECRTSRTDSLVLYNGCGYTGDQCNVRDYDFWQTMGGFQWYDVGQQHLLSNTTFRNCNPSTWGPCVWGCPLDSSALWTLLTHSDQYVPELMQQSEAVTYENIDPTQLWQFSTALSDPGGVTVSGRLQNWLDSDGSASTVFPLGTRTLLGSSWAQDWWMTNDACVLKQQMWVCAMQPGDSQASLYLEHNVAVESTIGTAICPNGNWPGGPLVPCPLVAKATHFGRAESSTTGLEIEEDAKVTGPLIASAGGWFVRFVSGVPKTLTIKKMQILASDALILALPYISSTTFTITANAPSWCSSSWATCQHPFTKVNSLDAVRKGFGDLYFFDAANGLLYLRVIEHQGTFGDVGADPVRWTAPFTDLPQFARDGLMLQDPTWDDDFTVTILAANCGGGSGLNCASNNAAQVPAALSGGSSATAVPSAKPTAATLKPTAATLKPTAATLKPTAATLKPTAATLKPTAATLKPTAATLKPTTSKPAQKPTLRPLIACSSWKKQADCLTNHCTWKSRKCK